MMFDRKWLLAVILLLGATISAEPLETKAEKQEIIDTDEIDRELLFFNLWKCKRICLFWCHCDDHECVSDHRSLQEDQVVFRDTNGLDNDDLAHLEYLAVKDFQKQRHGRRDFVFGECRPRSPHQCPVVQPNTKLVYRTILESWSAHVGALARSRSDQRTQSPNWWQRNRNIPCSAQSARQTSVRPNY